MQGLTKQLSTGGFDDTVDVLSKMGEEQMGLSGFFSCTLKAGDLFWVPMGVFMAERVIAGPLIYGVRKSYFVKSASGAKNMKALADALIKDGKDCARMLQIIPLLA